MIVSVVGAIDAITQKLGTWASAMDLSCHVAALSGKTERCVGRVGLRRKRLRVLASTVCFHPRSKDVKTKDPETHILVSNVKAKNTRKPFRTSTIGV
jgi:hypothetical protein